MADRATITFGARLRKLRELKKLTQSDLAMRAGLTPAAVSQLEADDRLPAFKTLLAIADALSVSVGTLLGESSAPVPQELKAFFRDLEQLDAQEVERVRDYAAFLRSQRESKDRS